MVVTCICIIVVMGILGIVVDIDVGSYIFKQVKGKGMQSTLGSLKLRIWY